MITCGFVGLGLIGGSIARALKANRKDIVIIACDPNEETLKLATEQKIADEAYPAPCDAFTACDYIFLCAPVSHNDENLLKILSYRKKDCILTDVGSVKTPINSLHHSLGTNGLLYRRTSDGGQRANRLCQFQGGPFGKRLLHSSLPRRRFPLRKSQNSRGLSPPWERSRCRWKARSMIM